MIKDINHKVVLIGDSMVGKTSILTRLLKGCFKDNYFSTVGTGCGIYSSTDGIDKTNLQIWDTAGQEKYRSLGKIFYQNAEAAILVISQTNPWTEENANNWLKNFREVAGDHPYVIVVASQTDISQINSKLISNWAKCNDLTFIETSAKTGQGIKELFEIIALYIRKSKDQFHSSKRKIQLECKAKCNNCC